MIKVYPVSLGCPKNTANAQRTGLLISLTGSRFTGSINSMY